MLKKTVILTVLLLFAVSMAQAQTETGSKAVICAKGKIHVGDQSVGGGASIALGYQPSENWIVWGSYGANKAARDTCFVKTDAVKAGFSTLTKPLIGETIGLFFSGHVGVAHIENQEDLELALLTNLGFYADLDSENETKFWLGISWDGIESVDAIYSINLGLSIRPKKFLW